MHTLTGTFVEKLPEMNHSEKVLYPIKLSLVPKFTRTLYLASKSEQESWFTEFKELTLSLDFLEFYDVQDKIGEGAMGEVRLVKHKKSQSIFACKYITKPVKFN